MERRRWVRWTVIAAAVGVLIVLIGLSTGTMLVLTAREALLPLGAELSFGFFDPHLHVSVVETQTFEAPGGEGCYRLVTIEVRNDAAQILIDPSRIDLFVEDSAGNRHFPVGNDIPGSVEGVDVATGLDEPLLAGESYRRSFLFRLEADEPRARLRALPRPWIMRVVPDHHNRFLTRRYGFALDPSRDEPN